MDPSGENLSEPNFARESGTLRKAFIREFCQNIIDARRYAHGDPASRISARMNMRIVEAAEMKKLDLGRVKKLFEPLTEHLKGAGHDYVDKDWDTARFLIIEEFDTVGLTGIKDDSRAEGEDQRWANFLFGEGKRSKTKGALGRAGQGKITYHASSGARSILLLTMPEDADTEHLFGKCILKKTHQTKKGHFAYHGYWPNLRKDGQPVAEKGKDQIAEVKRLFSLERDKEVGTSWVIPMIPDDFCEDNLLRELVGEFF